MPRGRSTRERSAAACRAAGRTARCGLVLGPGLLACAAAVPADGAAKVDSAAPTVPRHQVEAGFLYDDNVTRGRAAGEKRSDQAYMLQATHDWTQPLGRTTRVLLAATAGGEAFGRHHRLGRVYGEGQVTLEYRASGEFTAPTYSLFARVARDEYRSVLRSGWRYTVGATVFKPVTDRLSLLGAVAWDGRHARSTVFSGHRGSARVGLDYALLNAGTLYAGADYRRGDTTASGFRSLANIDIANAFVDDDAFAGHGDLLTYRLDARTVVATLGYNHGIGAGTAVDVSLRRAVTTPRFAAPFATGVPDRYVAHQLALSFLWRF